MNIVGIAAEFNPFHQGHAQLFKRVRAQGAQGIVVVMSGCFTQRGEPACMPPSVRRRAALQAGADLLIELPLPWAMASADTFAAGAVALLKGLGCVQHMVFGSESGNMAQLEACLQALQAVDGSQALANALAEGKSFPRARMEAVKMLFPTLDVAPLSRSNDTLALSYLRACAQQKVQFTPVAVRRDLSFLSGAEIRQKLEKNPADAWPHVPPEAATLYQQAVSVGAAPFCFSLAERAVLAQLRCLSSKTLPALPDVSEGIENRLVTAAKSAQSLQELYFAVKTKRYPLARVRRLVWHAFLHSTKEDRAILPPYLRVTGIGRQGAKILQLAGRTHSLPLLTRHSACKELDVVAKRIFHLEEKATDVYHTFLPRVQPAGLAQKVEILRF
ncbi:MAG TPA: hypothetical protein DEP42_02600 [Ruminococcaceae bacterium]|nr:hypothetical protein [Oscillospiraceae bacterium]